MNNNNLLLKTLRRMERSKHSVLLTPQGWGVYVMGIQNPQSAMFEWRRTQVVGCFAICDFRSVLVISNDGNFYNENPNAVFFEMTKNEHPYRLEWRYGFVPTALLGWWIERMKTFLYPFEPDSKPSHLHPIWWKDEVMVRIQFTHHRVIKMDGEYIPEPLHPLY